MDIELLYFSLILLSGYAGLRMFFWSQSIPEPKKASCPKDLRNICSYDSKAVKSAFWTRDLIQIPQNN